MILKRKDATGNTVMISESLHIALLRLCVYLFAAWRPQLARLAHDKAGIPLLWESADKLVTGLLHPDRNILS